MRNVPTELSIAKINELRAFSIELADAAAHVTLRHFRSQISVDNKLAGADFDPVTVADRDAETAIRSLIGSRYPEHGVVGEEHGQQNGTSPLHWVLDPIDGTRSFIAGVPLWGTLIALNDGAYPTVGLMDQPYIEERFVGEPGKTTLIRKGETRQLKTRACASLSEAILGCTDPVIFTEPGEYEAFAQARSIARLTRYGGDCYFYSLIAAGHIDLVIEAALQPYDIQALIPIVEGAGGIITAWDGGDPQQGGRVIAAGDQRVHEEALVILSSVD